jgi:hypothetical protein
MCILSVLVLPVVLPIGCLVLSGSVVWWFGVEWWCGVRPFIHVEVHDMLLSCTVLHGTVKSGRLPDAM